MKCTPAYVLLKLNYYTVVIYKEVFHVIMKHVYFLVPVSLTLNIHFFLGSLSA
jgi:hypothetical protein